MSKKLVKTLALLATMAAGSACAEQAVEGYWKSIDNETNKPTAYWKLEVRDNTLEGFLVTYPDQKADDVCDVCSGETKEFKNKPIMGTAWLHLEEVDDGTWEDGYIIDSGKGKKYKAKVWEENGELMVRGYIGFVYKTQVWQKASKEEAETGAF